MSGSVVWTLIAALLLLAPLPAAGAACAQACRDEVAACVSAECQGLTKRALRQCRKQVCRKPIVQACYGDLTVCGATRARRPPPQPPSDGGGFYGYGGAR
jgi:hypothetical protein